MKICLWGALIGLVLTVTGCVLTNPTDPYEEMFLSKGGFFGIAPRSELKPQPVTGPLTLENAIRIALAYNPALALQKWELVAAGARGDMAFAGCLPRLRARASYTNYINDQPLVPLSGSPVGHTFTDNIGSTELLLDVPLFTGGRIKNQIRAAELGEKAVEFTLGRLGRLLSFKVSRVFYSILAQQKVIDSLEFSRQALGEHLEQVDHLIVNQKATTVDRLRVEVRLANVVDKLARARNTLLVKRHTLANLLGVEKPMGQLELNGTLTLDRQIPDLPDGVISQAYEQRQDLLAARRRMESQAKQVDVARADRWPAIMLEAAYGERWDVGHMGSPENAGRVGLALVMPLFDGGRIRAAIREEKAKLGAAQESLRQLKLQISLEVKTAHGNVCSARERVHATGKAVRQGKESLRIERLKNRVGEATITAVLDAQAEMLEAQTNYYSALADYNTALAELDLALGRTR